MRLKKYKPRLSINHDFEGGGDLRRYSLPTRASPRSVPAPGDMPEVPAKFLAPAGGGGGKHRKRGKRKDAGGAKPNKAQGLGLGAPDRNDSDGEGKGKDKDDDASASNSSDSDEGMEGYRKGGYHPVKIGETFKDGRYVVRRKLGWGHFSTCWLCDDLQTETQIALKVQKSASHYCEAARDEIEILNRVKDALTIDNGDAPAAKEKRQRPHHRAGNEKKNTSSSQKLAASRFSAKLRQGSLSTSQTNTPEDVEDDAESKATEPHPGSEFVVTLLDSFDHKGPHGTHVCMTFPVLGDNLLDVIKRYDYRGAPLRFVKQMVRDVLLGMEYLHTRKKIIHTDLKPENVLLTKQLKSWEEVRAKESAAAAAVDDIVNNSVSRFSAKLRQGSLSTSQTNTPEDVEDDAESKATEPHPGSEFVVTLLDSFDHKGPHGTHVCMTFPVLGDNLLDVIKRYDYRGAPLRFVKQMVRDVLLGMEYLHTRKKIIHTDLKPENVLLTKQLKSWEEVRAKESAAAAAVDDIVNNSVKIGEKVSDEKCRTEAPGDMVDLVVAHAFSELDAKEQGPKEVIEQILERTVATVERNVSLGNDEGQDVGVSDANALESPTTDTPATYPVLDATETEFDDLPSTSEHLHPLSNTLDLTIGGATKKRALVSRGRGPTPTDDELTDINFRVVDLGNACWTYKQFTTDIQTRQYRCPEVILGSKYSTPADIWSAACLTFELATGDLLFDPRSGKEYDRDEDHLALMMELVGKMPTRIATGGKHSRAFFTRNGELRHIRSLKHWPLEDVLTEKYGFDEDTSFAMADFLQRMLHFDPGLRATANEALQHPWLDEVNPPREGLEVEANHAQENASTCDIRENVSQGVRVEDVAKNETQNDGENDGEVDADANADAAEENNEVDTMV